MIQRLGLTRPPLGRILDSISSTRVPLRLDVVRRPLEPTAEYN